MKSFKIGEIIGPEIFRWSRNEAIPQIKQWSMYLYIKVILGSMWGQKYHADCRRPLWMVPVQKLHHREQRIFDILWYLGLPSHFRAIYYKTFDEFSGGKSVIDSASQSDKSQKLILTFFLIFLRDPKRYPKKQTNATFNFAGMSLTLWQVPDKLFKKYTLRLHLNWTKFEKLCDSLVSEGCVLII